MSKQSEAKASQGYTTKPSNCANCKNLDSVIELPEWMLERNDRLIAAGRPLEYSLEKGHGIEKNIRCASGGFAVKKTATCNFHVPKDKS